MDPSGRNHYRKTVHKVAKDFEGRASRPQDHPGPQVGGRHRPGLEDAGHLMAGAQVLAQAFPPVSKATQVDNPVGSPLMGCRGKVLRPLTVLLGESPVRAAHGMHEIVDGPATLGRPHEGLPIQRVTGDDLDVRVLGPGPAGQFADIPGHGPHPVSRVEQQRDQPPSYIAGGARHQDRSGPVGIHTPSFETVAPMG